MENNAGNAWKLVQGVGKAVAGGPAALLFLSYSVAGLMKSYQTNIGVGVALEGSEEFYIDRIFILVTEFIS